MANTLKFGNGQWATGNGTALAYNDENANFKPLPFDFTRASSGTTVNQSGLIETVGSGLPRIDFEGNTKGALLLEPSRTNLLPYSNDFSNSAWQKNAIGTGLAPVVTPNSLISPDGTLNASKVVFNTGAGTSTSDISMLEDTISSTSGVSINQSVYLKGENGGETILIRGANGSSYTTLILTNKWVRYNATETSGATSSTWAIGLRQGLGGVLINSTATIYMAFAQFELGDYPTSYIPTSGSAVTRVADVCNNGGNEQVFDSLNGTLYTEMSALSNDLSYRTLLISDGTSANKIGFYFNTTSNSITFQYKMTLDVFFLLHTFSDVTSTNKIAFAWSNANFRVYVNGTKVLEQLNGATSSSALNQLDFSDPTNVEHMYANTKDLRVYNTALTDAELIALTT